jgi:hypothetical protein
MKTAMSRPSSHRPVTDDEHKLFIDALLTPEDHDEIDPHVSGTNNRRSDKELAAMLDLIDTLPISINGKDGSN